MTIPGTCWFCGQPDTRQHAWDCAPTIHVAVHLRGQLRNWIRTHWYGDQRTGEKVAKETWGSDYLVVWAMATGTDGFREDGLSVATADPMGVQFIKHAVDASIKLHQYRYTHREKYLQEEYPRLSSIRQWMHELWESKRRGRKGADEDPETEHGEEDAAGSDGTDWTTDEDEEEWETRLRKGTPKTGMTDRQTKRVTCLYVMTYKCGNSAGPRRGQVTRESPLLRSSWSASPLPAACCSARFDKPDTYHTGTYTHTGQCLPQAAGPVHSVPAGHGRSSTAVP